MKNKRRYAVQWSIELVIQGVWSN